MRIAVLAHGTRGDVYPLMALAAELMRRGHRVRMGASPNLVDVPRRLGIEAVPVGWDTQRSLASDLGQAWVNTDDVEPFLRLTYEIERAYGERVDGEVIDVCADCDAIVCGILLELRARVLAEARGIPLIVHDFFPRRANDVIPTSAAIVAGPPLHPAAIIASHHAFARLNWRYSRDMVLRFRGRLGLPPAPPRTAASGRPALELQAYSPALVPGLTWDAFRPLVGDLRLIPSDLHRLGMSAPDPDLLRWLEAAAPPALITFGSTHVPDPSAMLATIERVCRDLGVRGLVVTGWGLSGIEPSSSPDLKVVSYVDYDVVLPRCAMTVHHGSATVTMAGVRAGIPTMICSSSFDQPLWGSQLERLGVGVHVRFTDLTEDVLRAGMSRLTVDAVRHRAALLGERVRAEPHGTVVAADEIDKYLTS